jgi:hypothetical protein
VRWQGALAWRDNAKPMGCPRGLRSGHIS